MPVHSAWRGYLSARGRSVVVCFALGAALLAGCNVLTGPQDNNRPGDVTDRVRSIDILPRFPQAAENSNPGGGPRPVVVPGSGVPWPAPAASASPSFTGAQPAANGEGFELNFENAPVATVSKVVLGDIMGVGYTIDPRVQGTVTLATGRPIPKSDMIYVLENALRMSNVVLVRDSAGYRLMPLGEAVGSGNVDRNAARTDPGYGITVVPLQYVSAATLIKLLDSFAVRPGTVRADPARNLLVVQGSGPERRSAVETILSFDADWMRGQSVGLYPVQNSAPDAIIAELEKILDSGEGGLSQGMVKFQPVPRLNAVLVVARKPELLRTAGTWITRLDNSDIVSTGVKVYRVRYGEARQIARLLNDMFVGRGTSGLDSATNQLAPGSGLTTLSATERLGVSSSSSASGGPTAGRSPTSSPTGMIGGPLSSQPSSATAPTAGGSATQDAGGLASSTPFGGPGGQGGGQSIMPNVRITADAVNNTLLIYASQENWRVIERALRQIDRPQMQVAIDATIAEVTLNNNLAYGVQFFITSGNIGLNPDQGSALNTFQGAPQGTNGVVGPVISRVLPGFNFLVGQEAQPNVILDALHTVTDVKVLSNPSLVVMDNQVATLQVGDQVPVSTGSATVLTTSNTVVNTIDYRNTGIILRVVPRINVNGKVMLDIEQEISNVTPQTSASLTPTVSQRRVKSSVAVQSGQTVLLAGLISETQTRNRSGIPLLDQLPGALGDAFSHQNSAVQRTELIIFIRPQIIRDSVDAHFVAEELRSKLTGRVGVLPPGNINLAPGPRVVVPAK